MQLVFASNNPNKIKEIQLLVPKSIKILSLKDIGCHEEIEETEDTIEGNAALKANYVFKNYGYNCFADDSGLEVDFLNGKPGVHSARFAGLQKNDDDNMDKLLLKLQNQYNRKANFKTVIALHIGSNEKLFTGIVTGTISAEKRGNNGFGYDPIFIPDGYKITFAEMSCEQKNSISHRGIATLKLVDFINKNFS